MLGTGQEEEDVRRENPQSFHPLWHRIGRYFILSTIIK